MSETLRNNATAHPKIWPFEEAAKVAQRLAASGKDHALFETGYGPSGLPHIGTFGEVARTSWVRHAFGVLTGLPSRLIAFSDDMDGLRKVPDNVPNRDLLTPHLGKPLTESPTRSARTRASARTTMRGCAFDCSASTTNSRPPPTTTPAGSTPR
jgi:lysyl-tRNA synthetase class 1